MICILTNHARMRNAKVVRGRGRASVFFTHLEEMAGKKASLTLRLKLREIQRPAKNLMSRCTCAAQASMIGSASLSGGTNAPLRSPNTLSVDLM